MLRWAECFTKDDLVDFADEVSDNPEKAASIVYEWQRSAEVMRDKDLMERFKGFNGGPVRDND